MLAFSGTAVRTASADETSDAATVESARALFAEGNAHFHGGRWAAALSAFERSNQLVASPNTLLMIARSQRELGRPVEAAETFQTAALEAAKRVAKGDAKYSPTDRAATEEARRVRATLGSVRVRVARPEGVTLTIDGNAALLDSSGSTTAMHAPGSATVIVRDSAGTEQKQVVSVLAGSTVEMEFSGDAPPRATTLAPPPTHETPEPVRTSGSARSWAVPGAIGSGILTLAGTAVFIGFGSSSQATYDRLSAQCAPSCGPNERDDADTAKKQQTIANVGIIGASVAAIATIAFVVVALTSDGR